MYFPIVNLMFSFLNEYSENSLSVVVILPLSIYL